MYTDHPGSSIWYRISSNADDISSFDAEQSIQPSSNHTYANPFRLPNESRIYLFYRNGSSNLAYVYSDDSGGAWSAEQELVTASNKGPYFQVGTDQQGRLDFAVTHALSGSDGEKNDVRHFQFGGETAKDASGSILASASGGAFPMSFSSLPVVYDSDATGNHHAWVWDCKTNGCNPEIVYATFPDYSEHHYRYARYNGSSWGDEFVTQAGSHIESGILDERYYSGGITLDRRQEGAAYLSIADRHGGQIQHWTTPDNGQTWTNREVSGAQQQNIRPATPLNADGEVPVLWMAGRYDTWNNGAWNCGIEYHESKAGTPATDAGRTGGARAWSTSGNDVSGDDSWTQMALDSVDWDYRNEIAINKDAVSVARSGVYQIIAIAVFRSVSSAGAFRMRVNGETSSREIDKVTVASGEDAFLSGLVHVKLFEGENVFIELAQNSGSAEATGTGNEAIIYVNQVA